ncbi:hypothetical protein T03_980 [Trichinella britovi]|uniref:Uncharacterized protein n=1 Tax=Trichinella britovi TaxID=45882 RepID=A0A0V1CUB3_TRIBR|nr:hypothetical protein T03_980 [Trichinella britovi]
MNDVASVIPLRLTGGAFAVYLQLSADESSSVDNVKEALLDAFVTDSFVDYGQFVSRKLGPDESSHVLLAELRRLATLIGVVSEKALACAFVGGLPQHVRQLTFPGQVFYEIPRPTAVLMRLRSVRQGHSGKMPPKRIGHRSEKELHGGRGAVPILRNAARQPQRVDGPDEHYTHLHNQDAGRGSNGDSVWVRLPGARYDIRHHKVTVIGVVSEHAVEVDWMPRHVKDLRHRTSSRCAASDVSE